MPAITKDGSSTTALAIAKVDDSSDTELSNRKVEDMIVRTTPVTERVS